MTSHPYRFAQLLSVAALVVATAAGRGAEATTMRLASHDELVALSDLVVVATSYATRGRWHGQQIYTHHNLLIEEVIVGQQRSGDTIEVMTLGGRVENIGQRVAGAANIPPNTPVILYLAAHPDGGYVPVAMWQGLFLLDATTSPDAPVRVVRNQPQINLTGATALSMPTDLASLREAVRAAWQQ